MPSLPRIPVRTVIVKAAGVPIAATGVALRVAGLGVSGVRAVPHTITTVVGVGRTAAGVAVLLARRSPQPQDAASPPAADVAHAPTVPAAARPPGTAPVPAGADPALVAAAVAPGDPALRAVIAPADLAAAPRISAAAPAAVTARAATPASPAPAPTPLDVAAALAPAPPTPLDVADAVAPAPPTPLDVAAPVAPALPARTATAAAAPTPLDIAPATIASDAAATVGPALPARTGAAAPVAPVDPPVEAGPAAAAPEAIAVGAPGTATEEAQAAEAEALAHGVDLDSAVLDHDALPIPSYDQQTVGSLRPKIRRLDVDQLVQLRAYEQAHAHRIQVLTMLENRIARLRKEQAAGDAAPGDG